MASAGFLRSITRRVASSGLLPTRGGGGAPYPGHEYRAASKAVPEEADLMWDNGDLNPEPVLDKWAEDVSTAGALGMFLGGCSVFYGVWKYVELVDKPSQKHYVDREFPYLDAQLGR